MLTILTWLWHQENARVTYTTDHVNKWAEAIGKNCTIPHRIACVTDIPEGLDPSIVVIKPPTDFAHYSSPRWPAGAGLPQCYRRIAMFAPDAALTFGERFLCMDIDMLITGNIDRIAGHPGDFVMLKGTHANRPYNGGLILMNAGARPQVYTEFSEINARRASERYVGSDQAWISLLLGPGELTFGESDGAICYSPGYVTKHGGEDNFKLPSNVSMVFFPGHFKAFNGVREIWHSEKGVELFKTHRRIVDDIRGIVTPRLCAYDDPKGWGRAMQKQGLSLINDPANLRKGDYVFLRLDQQSKQRNVSLALHALATDLGCRVFPSLFDARVYDNKAEQLKVLHPWLPSTHYFTSAEDAAAYAKVARYPLISKSSEGAGSANVRMIASHAQALFEIRKAFGGDGIAMSYGRRQRDYLYWQDIIPGNDRDYRVVITGGLVHGLVRLNKEGTIFASGSGRNYPMEFKDHREKAAARFALEIARTIGTEWAAFDVIFDGFTPYVLEISAAWTVPSYAKCSIFTADLQRTDLFGDSVFAIAAAMMRGEKLAPALVLTYRLLKTCTLGRKGDVVEIPDCDLEALRRNNVIGEGPCDERQTA